MHHLQSFSLFFLITYQSPQPHFKLTLNEFLATTFALIDIIIEDVSILVLQLHISAKILPQEQFVSKYCKLS